ncbi:hypothetical protein ALC56_09692 [Trachymyrmex septentrionalis]|uniref:Uncharacterized protein n=1 Tax=Trachymyrmex septentrionalis TaxID=34720 RepID=A0A195F690_9HYME|nr:hypothetical protein ALC56_09692 [Trachymyrmex septentrionalis]
MPGQSARTARNVIAGSPSGDEKRALISRTILEELSRKLSKRCELAVAGSVSFTILRVSKLRTGEEVSAKKSRELANRDIANVCLS